MLWNFPQPPDDLTDLAKCGRFWGNAYYYYDTPDGQDLFKKMGAITRDTAVVSGIMGITYGKEVLHNKSNILAAVQAFKIAYPPVLASATFALVSYSLVKAQGKCDHYNYMWSGAVSGAIWSAAYKHDFWTGFGRSIFFGLMATLFYQIRVVEKIKFIPDDLKWTVRNWGYPQSREILDWTLTKDVPRQDW